MVEFSVLFQLEDDTDIHKMSQELNTKVTRLQSTLQRISAPNMRALEKLVLSILWSYNMYLGLTLASRCHTWESVLVQKNGGQYENVVTQSRLDMT